MGSRRLRMMASGVGLLLVLGVAAIASPSSSARARPAAPRRGQLTTLAGAVSPERLEAVAAGFMQQLQERDYAAQWSELAPAARALWPSAAGRSAMLGAKFTGGAAITSYSLGGPQPAPPWINPEDPAQRIVGGYQVPVEVGFADPSSLLPVGVAAFYQQLRLILVATPGSSPQVLGEGPASLDAPVIEPIHPAPVTARVPILMYHVVAPFPLRAQWNSGYGYRLEYGLTVTPGQFAAQMRFLASSGAHSISMTRLADFLLYGLEPPPKPVVITFDDGRESPYQNAVPVLTHYGFTATFFVPSGLVGKFVTVRRRLNAQHYLSWAQVTTLAQSGFWVEDHSLYDNVALWGLPSAEVSRLAGQSASALEQHTGRAVQFIAYSGVWPYPNAAQAGPSQRLLFSELGGLGYVGGAVDSRIDSDRQSTAGIWQLGRVRMNPNESGRGLAPWVQ
ncbi:MAG: polysaccharide deacetylase family protein [Candidatus Dormibacteria bacterium]